MSGKKRKIYGGLVVLGLIALLVDRVVLREPSSADAAAPRVLAERAAAGQDAGVGPTRASAVAAALFPSLGSGSPGVTTRDVFAPTPSAMLALKASAPQPEASKESGGGLPVDGEAEETAQINTSPAERLRNDYHLSAVIDGPAGGIAVVGDRWVRVGETFDGCELKRIADRTAVFDCVDEIVKLDVKLLGSDR